MLNLIVAQVLLMLVVGLWIGAKFKESPIIRFFGRNDWFVGAFLIIVGYMNFVIYPVQYIKNMNLLLIVFGLLLVLFSLMDLTKK